MIKPVEAVTCKEDAAIRVILSVETARMILLPENWRLIWPRTADGDLQTGWGHKSELFNLTTLVCVCVRACACVCVPYPFTFHCCLGWCPLTQPADCLSAHTNTDYEWVHTHTRTHTHTKYRDTFVNVSSVPSWHVTTCENMRGRKLQYKKLLCSLSA